LSRLIASTPLKAMGFPSSKHNHSWTMNLRECSTMDVGGSKITREMQNNAHAILTKWLKTSYNYIIGCINIFIFFLL
jgi:hypothetical protein